MVKNCVLSIGQNRYFERMLVVGQRTLLIPNGEAIFLPLERCLWDIRQASKHALLSGHKPQRFIVADEMMYYPGALDRTLTSPDMIKETLQTDREAMLGQERDCLRCVYLWEHCGEGVLLHLEEERLLGAYVPLVTEEITRKEHALSLSLATLAREAQSMSLLLERELPSGRYQLSELLHILSEQLDT